MIFPYCNWLSETVTLAHLNSEDKGIGNKSKDFWAVYSCSECHDIIDGRRQVDLSEAEILKCILRGLYRTQKLLIEQGLMHVES